MARNVFGLGAFVITTEDARKSAIVHESEASRPNDVIIEMVNLFISAEKPLTYFGVWFSVFFELQTITSDHVR